MQIDGKKYVRLAQDKELTSSQLAQVIRKETRQLVHHFEDRRQLFTGRFEETVCGNSSTSEVSIIDLVSPAIFMDYSHYLRLVTQRIMSQAPVSHTSPPSYRQRRKIFNL